MFSIRSSLVFINQENLRSCLIILAWSSLHRRVKILSFYTYDCSVPSFSSTRATEIMPFVSIYLCLSVCFCLSFTFLNSFKNCFCAIFDLLFNQASSRLSSSYTYRLDSPHVCNLRWILGLFLFISLHKAS